MVLNEDAMAEPPLLCWPLDHFYSPVADTRTLSREPTRSRVWPSAGPPATPGIDWRADGQVSLLRHLASQDPLLFPDGATGDLHEYHAGNEQFSRLDAWILQGMLRHLQPRRVIEVGSGWSSLVTARVNREFFDGSIDVTCIEPYPPDFLTGGVEGISRILVSRVEDVGIEPFLALGPGDVLFIDSSHTVKTGGDVVFLLHEVLPRLAPLVLVHFHDIFLPWDYPLEWVMSGRAWNEQYAVRSFLTFNAAFEILLSVVWLSHFRPEVLAEALPPPSDGYRGGGGSLWLGRVAADTPR
jgi:Methyltransferase domain